MLLKRSAATDPESNSSKSSSLARATSGAAWRRTSRAAAASEAGAAGARVPDARRSAGRPLAGAGEVLVVALVDGVRRMLQDMEGRVVVLQVEGHLADGGGGGDAGDGAKLREQALDDLRAVLREHELGGDYAVGAETRRGPE